MHTPVARKIAHLLPARTTARARSQTFRCPLLSAVLPPRPLATRTASRVSPTPTTAARRSLSLFAFRPPPGERGAPGRCFPGAYPVTLAGNSGGSGRLGPEPRHKSRATRRSAGEERACLSPGRSERERVIPYLSLASVRFQGQRAEWGQGTGQRPPASSWNLCSSQSALLERWLPPKTGREKERGWIEPRVCALGPDQTYFPSHSLCDNE